MPAAWSDDELLRDKDFAAYTDAERAVARAAARAARAARPDARSRAARARRAAARTSHDLRRDAARRRCATAASSLERRYRAPAARPRRLVLVVRRVAARWRPTRACCCSTCRRAVGARAARRGVRVRHAADARHARAARPRPRPRAARARPRAVADWSGGTRIGEALAELNREHGRRIGRGAVVVLLSDGWDRGEPEQLAAEMARLRRTRAPRRLAQPARAPTRATSRSTRGMQAALPHVDHLLPGNSLALAGGARRR